MGERIRILTLLSSVLGVLVPAIGCNKDPGPQVGEPVPEFTLPDLEGREHQLSDYRGKVVVLNFWATWCPPCIDEMPSLERLHDALADQGLAVVGVSVDERFSDIGAFLRKFELTFQILHDAGKKVSRKYQSFKYPETYIIDRSGRLKSKVVGPRDWSAPSVIRDLVELLKEEPAAAERPGRSREQRPLNSLRKVECISEGTSSRSWSTRSASPRWSAGKSRSPSRRWTSSSATGGRAGPTT